jgi:lipopolysaccharide export system protein LptC
MNRWFDRAAALLSVALLAILGLITFYLAELAGRDTPKLAKAPSTEPDYFVTGFSLLKLNNLGQPVLRLSAKKMTHFPDKDTSEFEQPRAISLNVNAPPTIMTADKAIGKEVGKDSTGADQLILIGNARLERGAAPGKPKLTVETESMTINIETETAYGIEPVKMTNGAAQSSAVGFEYDHQKQFLTLSANVKSTWPPKP